MENNGKGKGVFRVVLWAAAAVLSIVSLALLLWNYRTLEEATLFSERTAVEASKNFRFVAQEYKTTKIALDEANQKLVLLTQELETATTELSNTRGELTSVQQMNDQMKKDIETLEHFKAKALEKGEALEGMIMSFKKKNKELDSELQGVRKELAGFQPDISDLNEGQTKIKRFKDHIRLVKVNMNGIKRKAYEARVEAQKEKDRVEAIYGNGGFMVKDGQDKSVNKFKSKVVDINVQFVNP